MTRNFMIKFYLHPTTCSGDAHSAKKNTCKMTVMGAVSIVLWSHQMKKLKVERLLMRTWDRNVYITRCTKTKRTDFYGGLTSDTCTTIATILSMRIAVEMLTKNLGWTLMILRDALRSHLEVVIGLKRVLIILWLRKKLNTGNNMVLVCTHL